MKTHSDELTLFVAVVEAGSFRQAAENLGMDNSVGRVSQHGAA